jgi:hypothetical protein
MGRERVQVGLAMAFAAATLALAGVYPVSNPDAFGHLAQGRNIIELGAVPQRDPFSFWQATPAPFRNYEWLSDWVMYELWTIGGPNALIAAKCLLLALAGALLVLVAQRAGGKRAALACALLLLYAVPAARFRFSERPQVVAFPLVALYLLGLCALTASTTTPRARRLWLAGLTLAHVLWVNLHGSHLLGFVLTALFFGAARGARKPFAQLLALQLAASCVSPYGPAILIDALAHVADPRYRALVREWGAWSESDPLWLLLAPILQCGLLLLVAQPLVDTGPAGRGLLACALLLALACLRSLRFTADFLLLSAPVIAWGFAERTRELQERRLALAGGAFLLIGLPLVPWGALHMPPRAGIALGQNLCGLPAASSQWLAEHLAHPRVLAAMDDAWFVLFGAPNAKVLLDGRVPFYGVEHVQRVQRAWSGEPALGELLARYRVDSVVLRHSFAAHARIHRAMRARPDFTLVAIEDEHSLFVRSTVQLRDGSHPRPLALEPGYEVDWLRRADGARAQAILHELARLPRNDNVRGYEGWVRSQLALRPLCRAGCNAGLRAPRDAAERELLRQVQGWLARSARGTEGVPAISAYLALVATDRCELDTAERALEDARREGESRDTLLVTQEIALRRGEVSSVNAFLKQAAALPGMAADPWLAALREEVGAPPRCLGR